MSYKPEQLLVLTTNFEKLAAKSLGKEAAKKDKKVDPKAKVRNRGTVCVPAESAKDKKDHFPINDEAQARNALARVNQFSSVPEWYSGSLQSLVSLVARKVHSKYPGIKVSKDAKKPGKKKASEYYDSVLNKYAQPYPPKDTSHPDDPNAGPLVGGDAMVSKKGPHGENTGIGQKLNTENVEGDWAKWEQEQNAARQRRQQEQTPVSENRAVPTTTPTGAPGQTGVAKSTKLNTSGIPFRADVRAAQIQFNKWNKQNGNYTAPIDEDGKLGNKTKSAFHGYRPGVDVEVIIKDLSEQGMTWSVRTPEPKGNQAPPIASELAGKPKKPWE